MGRSITKKQLFVRNTTASAAGLSSPVGASDGGTGITSYAIGDIIYASGATTLSKLPIGTASQQLRVNAGATALEYFTPASSGLTVGTTTITSGTTTRVLFQDGSTVGQSANFSFDKTYVLNSGNLKAGNAISLFELYGTSAVYLRRAIVGSGFYLGNSATGNTGEFSAFSEFSIGTNANCSGQGSISIGANSSSTFVNSFALGHYAVTTATNQMVIGAPVASGTVGAFDNVYFNGVTHTAPAPIVMNACGGSGTNNAGASLTLAGGKGTGNAAGGNIIFQTSTAGASGTTLQTLQNVARAKVDSFFDAYNGYDLANGQMLRRYSYGGGIYSTYIGVGRPVNSTIGNLLIGDGFLGGITGNYNTVVGEQALLDGTSGSENTIIGYFAGRGVGSNNILLGGHANGISTGVSNTLVIGSENNAHHNNDLVANDASIGMSGVSGGYKQFYFGQGKVKVSPDPITFNVTGGSGANNAGSNFTIASGKGTGSATTGGDIIFQTSDAAASSSTLQTLTTKYTIKKNGVQDYPTTVTAGGTTGDQTINKVSGTINFAAGATAITVTNSLVSTTSIVFAVVRTNDTTATIKNVVSGSGSFVITLTAAATAETSVGFFTINS
jgi:hypothetical protein